MFVDLVAAFERYRFAVLPALLFVAGFAIWLRRDRRLDKMPGPRGFPLIGIGISLPDKAHVRFREWAAQYGEVFKLRVGWFNWVVINSPQAMHEILNKQVNSM